MTRYSGICGKFASFTAATVSHSQPHAATCSHLQPLPDTHNHTQPLAATRSHSSGRKWPQVTAAVKWPQVAASGRFRQVAASGRKWPLFPISNSTPNATPLRNSSNWSMANPWCSFLSPLTFTVWVCDMISILPKKWNQCCYSTEIAEKKKSWINKNLCMSSTAGFRKWHNKSSPWNCQKMNINS